MNRKTMRSRVEDLEAHNPAPRFVAWCGHPGHEPPELPRIPEDTTITEVITGVCRIEPAPQEKP